MNASSEEYRRPLLTARQVGIVAAFGGLGFAWRALGLVIPLIPPWVMDVRYTLLAIASFAGGPYVGIACGILYCIPSPLPFMLDFPQAGVLYASIAYTVWNHRKSWGYVVLIVAAIIIQAYMQIFDTFFLAYVAQLVPFWPGLIASFSVPYGIYVIQVIIPIILAIRLFPDFMKPRWSWRGGEKVED